MKSPMKRGPHLRYIRRNREAHRGNGTRTERQGAEYYHPEQRAYTFIHHSLHSTFNYNVGMFTNCMNECPAQVGVLSMRPVPGSWKAGGRDGRCSTTGRGNSQPKPDHQVCEKSRGLENMNWTGRWRNLKKQRRKHQVIERWSADFRVMEAKSAGLWGGGNDEDQATETSSEMGTENCLLGNTDVLSDLIKISLIRMVEKESRECTQTTLSRHPDDEEGQIRKYPRGCWEVFSDEGLGHVYRLKEETKRKGKVTGRDTEAKFFTLSLICSDGSYSCLR